MFLFLPKKYRIKKICTWYGMVPYHTSGMVRHMYTQVRTLDRHFYPSLITFQTLLPLLVSFSGQLLDRNRCCCFVFLSAPLRYIITSFLTITFCLDCCVFANVAVEVDFLQRRKFTPRVRRVFLEPPATNLVFVNRVAEPDTKKL